MILAMRELALDYLLENLFEEAFPVDVEAWYQDLRQNNAGRLFPYLVEDSGRVDKVFIIEAEDEDTARLTVEDVVQDSRAGGGCHASKLPFMKPSGSQSAAVGPVIKRTYSKKGSGPSKKILNTTMNYFAEVALSKTHWADYFQEILEILQRPKLRLLDGQVCDWLGEGYESLLECAVDKIGFQKNTVFLTLRDNHGYLPGDRESYIEYLLNAKLAGDRYVTKASPAKVNACCPLCGQEDVTVFPNAIKGAGINLINTDRIGVFPGIDPLQAWKGYALCAACADLLYIYKFHVLKKGGPDKTAQPFSARIAGENALVIPEFFPGVSRTVRRNCLIEVQEYINNFRDDVEMNEYSLLDRLQETEGILNFTILWADIGQNIENVTGMISQVLPSRLRELSQWNFMVRQKTSPFFPKLPLQSGRFDLRLQLALTALNPLFHRPGGQKAKDVNSSGQLFQLKRCVAQCVYHGQLLEETRFWAEWLVTARHYLAEAVDSSEGYKSLLYEWVSKNGDRISMASWIKYFNWYVHYFRSEKVGVFPMYNDVYKPNMEALQPYFGPESGINTPEKSFAFLLGVLYGKLLQVQGARGVNVGSNALTWLKRLNLKGNDLPELYIKIREKLLAYESEKSPEIRTLLQEIGLLGVRLGDSIHLDEVATNYFLLLGQSMMESILPTKSKERQGD
ncbi:MAG: TM1802 family CRISPR-associated protein [Dehalobacterium sp.]